MKPNNAGIVRNPHYMLEIICMQGRAQPNIHNARVYIYPIYNYKFIFTIAMFSQKISID